MTAVEEEDIDITIRYLLSEARRSHYPESPREIKERYSDTAFVLLKKTLNEDSHSNYLSFGTRRSSSISHYGNTPIIIRRSISSSSDLVNASQYKPLKSSPKKSLFGSFHRLGIKRRPPPPQEHEDNSIPEVIPEQDTDEMIPKMSNPYVVTDKDNSKDHSDFGSSLLHNRDATNKFRTSQGSHQSENSPYLSYCSTESGLSFIDSKSCKSEDNIFSSEVDDSAFQNRKYFSHYDFTVPKPSSMPNKNPVHRKSTGSKPEFNSSPTFSVVDAENVNQEKDDAGFVDCSIRIRENAHQSTGETSYMPGKSPALSKSYEEPSCSPKLLFHKHKSQEGAFAEVSANALRSNDNKKFSGQKYSSLPVPDNQVVHGGAIPNATQNIGLKLSLSDTKDSALFFPVIYNRGSPSETPKNEDPQKGVLSCKSASAVGRHGYLFNGALNDTLLNSSAVIHPTKVRGDISPFLPSITSSSSPSLRSPSETLTESHLPAVSGSVRNANGTSPPSFASQKIGLLNIKGLSSSNHMSAQLGKSEASVTRKLNVGITPSSSSHLSSMPENYHLFRQSFQRAQLTWNDPGGTPDHGMHSVVAVNVVMPGGHHSSTNSYKDHINAYQIQSATNDAILASRLCIIM